MKTFGERLRDLRHASGLSLGRLGRKIGRGKGYLSGIENGKVNPPSPKVIRKLAEALDHDVKELMMVAYVEKAPREIRKELEEALLPMVAA